MGFVSTPDAAPTYVPFRRSLIHLAGDLLTRRPGDRLPPGEEYQRRLGVGSGTFLRALRALEELGAVAVESRGYRGTVLAFRDVSALWRAAERGPVRVAFTPPGAPDHYGLAVGYIEELRLCGLPVSPMFAWSGAVRGRWLTEGHVDVAVMSLAAARSVQAIEPKIAVRDGSPVAYYGFDQVVVVSTATAGTSGRSETGLRVGVDNSSPDHVALTQREFADVDGVEWVQCRFRDVPAQILAGQIDAGVWHRIDAPISPELAGLVVRSRRSDGRPMVESETAAWCYRKDAADIEAVIDLVDVEHVRATQDEVMAMDRMDVIQTRLWAPALSEGAE